MFLCNDPECHHYMMLDRILGKKVSCGQCGNEMIFSAYNGTTALPRCLSCSNTKKSRALKKMAEVPEISNILDQIDLEKENAF